MHRAHGKPASSLLRGGGCARIPRGAEKPGGASRVAAEIQADDLYVRFDPAILRGGDAAGRSQATVAISTVGSETTFVVDATTPDTSHGDEPIHVSLTLTCAP